MKGEKVVRQKLSYRNFSELAGKAVKEKGLFSFVIMLINCPDCLQEKACNSNAEKCEMNQAYHLVTVAFGDL